METTVPQLKWPNKKGRWQSGNGRGKKGETEKERESLPAGRGVQVETSLDTVRLIQGQPSVPRTSRPFKSTVFWDSWQSILAIMLMKTQIYVVTIWMLGNDSTFFWYERLQVHAWVLQRWWSLSLSEWNKIASRVKIDHGVWRVNRAHEPSWNYYTCGILGLFDSCFLDKIKVHIFANCLLFWLYFGSLVWGISTDSFHVICQFKTKPHLQPLYKLMVQDAMTINCSISHCVCLIHKSLFK